MVTNLPFLRKPMKFINKFSGILKIGKGKAGCDVEKYLDRVDKEPGNTKAHLKLAKSYEKRGEMGEATKEYLLAAASFTRSGHYPQALTVYKHILKENPSLDRVELKIAELYGKMGELENAYSVYERLLNVYNKQGRDDKAQEVMCLMAELSMQTTTGGKVRSSSEGAQLAGPPSANATSGNIPKPMPSDGEKKKVAKVAFDLGAELETHQPMEVKGFSKITAEKIYGFNDIFKELKRTDTPSTEFPDFNFHMGVACRQMGYIDEAIEQFRLALEKGQNPCEAAHLLGRCFWDKGLREEARRSFEIALKVEGIPQEKIREIKDDLALVA
jgi:tetratricopeptide (TPR) repeat protein